MLRDTALDLIAATDVDEVAAVVNRAVTELAPPGCAHRIVTSSPDQTHPLQYDDGTPLVPVIMALPDGRAPVGALAVDRVTAARADLRPALETISAQAAQALARIQLERQVARFESDKYLDAVVEQTSDVVLILDDSNRIQYASPSARTVFGTSALHGAMLLDVIDEAERRTAEALLRRARQMSAAGDTGATHADWTIHAPDGRTVLVEVTCRDLRAEASVRGVVLTVRDVTGQRRLEHELTKRVFRDPLTGLPNRLLFRERLAQALDTDTGRVGVALIDLDNFKAVNDSRGHDAGDTVLRIAGHRIGEALGSDGIVARLGDDEFAALIPDAASAVAVDEVVGRIARSLADPIPLDTESVPSSASVGITTSVDGGNAQELLRQADLALQAAKSAGHGQWRHYDAAMTDAILYRLELRSDLNHALRDGTLLVEYQPIVALDTGATAGFEALVRWQHPTRGRLPPDEFIDIAEESGLIVPIGEWVLGTALTAATRWTASGHDAMPYISVNVSTQQFRSSGFVDTVGRLLHATGLPPRRLVLEITESLRLRDDDDVWEELRHLRQLGVRIAIDDFGTGYSALGYLRQVPLDMVKLDRLFTSELTTSARQRELVEGIVHLTHGLNLDVVAEGIETEEQRAISAAIGCAYGQGYLFARPMPEADAAIWLTSRRPS